MQVTSTSLCVIFSFEYPAHLRNFSTARGQESRAINFKDHRAAVPAASGGMGLTPGKRSPQCAPKARCPFHMGPGQRRCSH